MSVNAMKWAWDQEVTDSTAKFVLVALSDWSSDHGQGYELCWHAQATIAQRVQCSLSTVKRALAFLEEHGFIIRTKRGREDGGRTSDEIRLCTDRGVKCQNDLGVKCQNELPPPVKMTYPPRSKRATNLKDRTSKKEPTIAQSALAHPQADDATATAERVQREAGGYIPTDFEAFWSAYPKKKGKEPARKLWAKLGQYDRRAAIEGVARYQRETPDRRFQKYGSSYLKDRAWEDHPDDPAKPLTEEQVWESRAARVGKDWRWGPEKSWGPKLGEPGCRMPQHLQDRLKAAYRALSAKERERLTP